VAIHGTLPGAGRKFRICGRLPLGFSIEVRQRPV
jgi:hypothetical protein